MVGIRPAGDGRGYGAELGGKDGTLGIMVDVGMEPYDSGLSAWLDGRSAPVMVVAKPCDEIVGLRPASDGCRWTAEFGCNEGALGRATLEGPAGCKRSPILLSMDVADSKSS